MKKELSKWSKELRHSLWVILILTIVFAFNDPSEVFGWNSWLSNFLRVLILVGITIFVHIISAKLAARHFDQKAELRLWGIDKVKFKFIVKVNTKVNWDIFGFKIKSLPVGVFASFLLTLMSYGTFYFTAVSTIILDKVQRIGSDFLYLREKNEALIYFWSLFGNLILVAVFSLLGMNLGVTIGSYFILWNLLPISSLLGAKIFFNNKILYVFFLVFALFFLLLLGIINLAWLFIVCGIFAFLITLWYFFKIEYK